MKAVVYTHYGPADVLRLVDVDRPKPKKGEILIKVHAATATTGDSNVRGFTFISGAFKPMARLMFGWSKPRQQILGGDIAGEVVEVGPDVTRFKTGDQVFGTSASKFGAYAEYACRAETDVLLIKPADLSTEEVISLPFGAGTALLFLRDRVKLRPGQKVLVVGAAGGVGVYAVQLAKAFGAEVTGVCSSGKIDLVKSLGADDVIDYTREDFKQSGRTWDVIVDTVPGANTFSGVKSSLTEKGIYAPVAGGVNTLLLALWSSMRGGKKIAAGPAFPTREDLEFLVKLTREGKIRAVIDRRFPLDRTAQAHAYVDTGHKTGSVIIDVAQP